MMRDLIMAQVNQWLASQPDDELMRLVEIELLPRLRLEQVLKLQLLVNSYVDQVRARHNRFAAMRQALVEMKPL